MLTERPDAGGTMVRSVYVHAPFCARRCVYCDFAVHVSSVGDVDAWAGALAGELRAVSAEGLFDLAEALDTLYIGGGTPSLLGPDAMHRVAEIIGRDRLGSPALEWTSEANPESYTDEVAEGWRAAGLNRLSLGVQSFHEPALRWMGRMHGADGAREAVARARRHGVTNLSIDLIFGLPADTGRSWTHDLERAIELDVPHVSLYGLTIESGTRLGRAVAEGTEAGVDGEQYREEFLEAAQALCAAGYEHYEVSNFARPGFESRHNPVYWDGRPYLGLGNGAHSYAHPIRRWNHRDWVVYRDRASEGLLPEESRETIDDEARALEAVWLGLRTSRGIDATDLTATAHSVVARWESAGQAVRENGRIRLTAEGWLLLDEFAVELDGALMG